MTPKEQENLNSFYEYLILAIKLLFIMFLFNIFRVLVSTKGSEWVFLDYANFAIHEGGHFLFSLFSDQLWTILGGTLTQLAVPLLLILYFLIRRNKFSMGFCLFWLGDNFVNMGPYIGDARCQCMDITGTIHDWNFILGHFNLLNQDTYLAQVSLILGLSISFIALIILLVNVCKDFILKISHR